MSNKIRSGLRSYLRKLSGKRVARTFCADDAHRYLDKQGKMNTMTKLGHINSILNNHNGEVVSVGETYSSRPAAKGRMITTWQFADFA